MQTELTIDPKFSPLGALDGQYDQHRWASDDKLHVRFRKVPILNPYASTMAGRAIFDEKDFITIFTPGSQLSVIDSPVVGTKYEHRFAKQYQQWKVSQQNIDSGTPLESFPLLFNKVGLIAELKAMNVHMVEQLANLSDGQIQHFMGGSDLRAKAKEWLEKTTGVSAQLEKLREENKKLAARLDEVQGAKVPPKAATVTK